MHQTKSSLGVQPAAQVIRPVCPDESSETCFFSCQLLQLLHLFDAFEFPSVGRSYEKYFRCSLLFQLKHHVIFFSPKILFNERYEYIKSPN